MFSTLRLLLIETKNPKIHHPLSTRSDPIFMLMDNHKLIQILNTFDKKEWREFSKFVESPYFNTDKHCIRLMQILKKEFAKKSGFQLSRARLEKLFSKNNPSDASLLNVKLSLLTRLAEQFFRQQELEENPLLCKHLLLKRFFKQGLNNHFESTYRRDIDLHESPKKVNAEHYLYKYLIQHDFLRYNMAVDKKTLLANENLQATNESLDVFYIIRKIDLYNRMSMIRTIFQKKYDMVSFQFVESMALLPCYTNHPIIQLYYALFMLHQTPSPQNFNHLRMTMRKYIGDLEPPYTKSFYIASSNYCAEQIRKGENYDEEVHEIYAEMEEAGLFATREWTDIRILKNAIVSGLIVKKFEWAVYIIEKYKDKIEPSIRESTYNYLLALCAIEKKEFDEAVGYLLQAGNVDFEFNMNIKSHLIQCYYERDIAYNRHTEQAIRSYKVFFKQSKYFSDQTKDIFINFGNIIHYLYRAKHNEGRATIKEALKKMEQYESVMYRDWLLEKIEELQNRPIRRAQY